MSDSAAPETYSYLGPAGTFTEAALAQVPQAAGKTWRPVNNVGQALDDVVSGRSVAAMIAIENTVDGGVSASQDALATIPNLRIIGEYLVNVNFVLVARPGTTLADVKTINAHPVAYGQTHLWVDANLPDHGHLPATSNVAAASSLFDNTLADAAIAPPTITTHYNLDVLAENIGDNPNAQTRFVLVSQARTLPEPTGSDKTSIIAELPDDTAGRLLEMLEQFATRGEHEPAGVAADRGCPWPLPLCYRPRRACDGRTGRGRPARPQAIQPERDFSRVVPARRQAADHGALALRQ